MKGFKEPSLADRLGAAAKARQAQLEKARAKSPANDPNFAEKQAARMAAAQAREARVAERKAQKLAAEEERKRIAAEEEAARIAAQKAAEYAREAAAAEALQKAAESIAARKAERDARYAARKARKK
jgi:hypothetical protein